MNIRIDDSDFQNKMKVFLQSSLDKKDKATRNVASEVLRLSQREVPHDVGSLQNSGFVQDGDNEAIVGYNMVYAARLHENPQYNFQKGRKGKYLEDPIKNNLRTFRRYFEDIFR